MTISFGGPYNLLNRLLCWVCPLGEATETRVEPGRPVYLAFNPLSTHLADILNHCNPFLYTLAHALYIGGHATMTAIFVHSDASLVSPDITNM